MISPGPSPHSPGHRDGIRKVARESRAVWARLPINKRGQSRTAPIIGEPRGNSYARKADLLIGRVDVLIAEEAEELVFDNRAAERTPGHSAMQLGIFFAGGNIGVGVEKKRGGVHRVGAAMYVSAAVIIVGARGGAHVNVRAAGGTLLGVVHGSVDAEFLDGFRRGSRQRLANGQIGRGSALDNRGTAAGGAADTGIIHHARGGHLAGALAIKEIAGVNAIEKKTVAGVALAVCPDGLVTEAAVGTGPAGQLRVDTWGKNREASKTPSGQGNFLDLAFLQDVAVGGVFRIQERRGFDGNGCANLPDF